MNSSIDKLNDHLEFIIEKAVSITKAKAGSLLLLNPKTDKLFFKIATGDKAEKIKKFEIKLGQGIAGTVAKTGKPILSHDVTKDKNWNKTISESIGYSTHSIACVPMKIKDSIIGVVEIIDKIDNKILDKTDLETLSEFAELAAKSIGDVQHAQLIQQENETLKERLSDKYQIIGNNKKLIRVINQAKKVARSKASTLILGESGTGKELLAALIHNEGSRKNREMIIINCAALPDTLLEAELFGYEKGSYTGAVQRKIGKFELADNSTIFLDEIAEMKPEMQAKMLRVLQEGVFSRIGGNTSIKVDVRIISATNKNIIEEIEKGNFREDLYFRLNVVQLKLPSLRERKDDIVLLSEYFIKKYANEMDCSLSVKISKDALDKMIAYNWPGNIRELSNAIERALVMGDGKKIIPEDLPIKSITRKNTSFEFGLTLKDAIRRFKKEFILLNLTNTSNNKTKAAKIMGIQRTYLSRLISKYDLK